MSIDDGPLALLLTGTGSVRLTREDMALLLAALELQDGPNDMGYRLVLLKLRAALGLAMFTE